jgi:hypothetical protein
MDSFEKPDKKAWGARINRVKSEPRPLAGVPKGYPEWAKPMALIGLMRLLWNQS